ncbi:hypothetical protein GCM10027605_54540 [Micromonospora zhanjiangensis]
MSLRSLLPKLLTLVLCGVLAGLALAAAALPANTLVGLVTKSASDNFAQLPSDLRTPPPAQLSYVYANDGKTLITTFYDVNRINVPLDQIAPVMRQAMVAAEDVRFYQHNGVDMRSLARAFVVNSNSDDVSQGGSTLTMQYVRNVLKTDPNLTEQERQKATETTKGRKVQEIRYAVALEHKISKDEILNRYLNIAYFGAGAYGIDAASQRYFGKSPAKLTLAEAALIAGLVQSPDVYSPIGNAPDQALARRAYVLDSMVKMGHITADQAAQAKAEKLVLRPTEPPNGCTATPSGHDDWGFFCDYLRQWWREQPAFGATPQEREQALRQGGYSIVTSLDPKVQAEATKQATKVYGYNSPRALPIAAVEPGTGRVLAMAVNRHYSLKANPKGQANRPNTVNQLIAGGGNITGYQAGSTFKMFVMLAALEAGKPLSTSFDAPAKFKSQYPDGGPVSCDGYWCPSNANPKWMDGQRNMWTGFGRSVNTYFVWLEQQVGVNKAVEMAQRLGIRFRAESDATTAKNSANWGRSPWVSRPPRRWTWPTRTPPWPATGCTARRCRWCRSPVPTGRRSRPVSRVASGCSTRASPARPPTRPVARSASSRRSASATAVRPARSARCSAVGRWPARPGPRRTTPRRRSPGSPRRWPRPVSPRTRTILGTRSATGCRRA